METFPISPDDCLVLKAIKETGSLREAAALLACDPAGLARRVQAISSSHGFLRKINNRWQVSPRGIDLVAWADKSIQSQKQILLAKSSLRLATTMWFSEEVIIPNVSLLKDSSGKTSRISVLVPGGGFESAIIDGSVDFAIVCNPPENPEIEHRQVAAEKWTIVAPRSWQKDLKIHASDPVSFLRKKPFVRHNGVNLDLLLPHLSNALTESDFSTDHLIGVRSAVCEGLGWSIVPQLLISRCLRDGRLVEVAPSVSIADRKVCVWWLRNQNEMKRQSSRICSWVKQITYT